MSRIKKALEKVNNKHGELLKRLEDAPRRNFLFEHIHEGVLCLSCGKVLISYFRHDYKTCGCPQETMIDGGQIDYVRIGGADMSLVRQVEIVPLLRTKTGKASKRKLKTVREMFDSGRKK